MKLPAAIDIAKDCARAQKMLGLNADVPYTVAQLADATVVIWTELSTEISRLRADLVVANRQTAAANARAVRREKDAGSDA